MQERVHTKNNPDGYMELAAAVVKMAIYDYKKNPSMRATINNDMTNRAGALWLSMALPESQLSWNEIREEIAHD